MRTRRWARSILAWIDSIRPRCDFPFQRDGHDGNTQVSNWVRGDQGGAAEAGSFGGLLHLFALSGQPGIELRPRFLGDINKAQAGVARFIHPGNLDFWFQRGGSPRQIEGYGGNPALGQRTAKENGHAALAEISNRDLHLLPFAKGKRGRHFHGMPEIAPPFAHHEVDRGAEATFGVQRRNWLLQNKICSHLEGLLGGGAAVHDGESGGIPIAHALAKTFQHTQSALQIIAIDYDGVKPLGTQDFLARVDPAADLDVNGQLLQGGLNHTNDFGVPAEKQRLQLHRNFMVTFLSGEAIVTKVIGVEEPAVMCARLPRKISAASTKPETGILVKCTNGSISRWAQMLVTAPGI